MDNKYKKISIVVAVLIGVVGIFTTLTGSAAEKNKKAEMVIFYSPSCPHCHDALKFLDSIEQKYKNLKITKYNTSKTSGANYYFHYTKKLNLNTSGVPLAVFGDKYELGYGTDDTTGQKYISHIEELLKETESK